MNRWALQLAWREMLHQKSRWVWFILATGIGIGAVSGVSGLSWVLQDSMDREMKSLLGSDAVISSREPTSDEVRRLIDSLSAEKASDWMFASMIAVPRTGESRLIQVRVWDGAYPFYGKLDVDPPDAARQFREGDRCLVDDAVLIQYGLDVGDTVRLGAKTFEVAGRIRRMPGQAAATSLVSPPVIIRMKNLPGTELIQRGSRIVYRTHLRLDGADAYMRASIKLRFQDLPVTVETADDRRESFGRLFGNVTTFLQIMVLVAFLLAGVSIGSALRAYVRERWTDIAVLRCLGAGWKQTLAVFFAQLVILSTAGTLLGVGFGVLVQAVLPTVLQTFLPVPLEASVPWSRLVETGLLMQTMTLAVGVLPLLPIRNISPLLSLRTQVETRRLDLTQMLASTVILLLPVVVIRVVLGSWTQAAVFWLGIGVILVLLYGVAAILIRLSRVVRWRMNRTLSYAVAHLHRPGNQTKLMMLVIGVCVLMMASVAFLQNGLIQQISVTDERQQPNVVLFDIQPDQHKDVRQFLEVRGLEILQDVPIVTMRLRSVKGRSLESLRSDSTLSIPRWVGEFRSTYRDTLSETEMLVAGSALQSLNRHPDSVWVSMEKSIAEQLGVTIGDSLEFDVQGVRMWVRVGNLREVNWRRVQPNFYMVFPTEAVRDAPQIFAIVTRVADPQASAALQRDVVATFPNVSVIDLRLILATLQNVLDQFEWVIRFMATFTIGVALLILVSSIWSSRGERIRESMLLRTLGAPSRLIWMLTAAEFLILSCLAASGGLLLAGAASWSLLYYLFDTAMGNWISSALAFLLGTAILVVGIGVALNRRIVHRTPMELIRAEG